MSAAKGGSVPAMQGPAAPSRTITVDTDLYIAQVTSAGGRLASLRLKKYRENTSPDSPLYEMVRPGPGGVLPLGVLVDTGGSVVSDRELTYTTDEPSHLTASANQPAVVRLTGHTRDGVTLTKTFSFTNGSYVFDLQAALAGNASGIRGSGLSMSQPLVALEGYADVPELEANVGGKMVIEREKALAKGVAAVSGPVVFAGFGDRYFLSVYLPKQPANGTLQMDYTGEEAHARLLFDGAKQLDSAVYMGPKELDVLETINPALSKSIDFGFMGIIALPFLRALKLFYRIAPNYGVAIILLTIVVRLLTLPMSIKGQRSMMRMQRLQPQIERIRERYKDDQDRLNREMVDLYKRNHVNPIGGCLPMLIQLPILWGLYEALLNSIELRQAPFIGWIRDLSAPDCLPIPGMPELPMTHCHGIPVLVVLLAASAILQQWLAPRQPDPSQQKMMMYMPVFFSFIFISLPSGLSLYYLASNVLGVIQQVFLNYEFKQQAPATT
jgi:YidC/Oxa1 family membrane protein insertase